ncbi:hypothetical protein EV182_006523 [Spiromyces aspiralis]|uniref:Uncharacterized protein n=1 Tax=Spiromyces aspiralis TaxID=68401 RepID=A0ACC1HM52_9FUNG|nr:hypothetical protein EV182_006523 [Spiromyces aspiralis]
MRSFRQFHAARCAFALSGLPSRAAPSSLMSSAILLRPVSWQLPWRSPSIATLVRPAKSLNCGAPVNSAQELSARVPGLRLYSSMCLGRGLRHALLGHSESTTCNTAGPGLNLTIKRHGHWDRWHRHQQRQGRGWRWPFTVNISPNGLVWAIIGANVVVFLTWNYARRKVQLFRDLNMLAWMNKNFTSSLDNFKSGRVWTMLTSAFSHTDPMHLLVNMIVLQSFGPPLAMMLGSGRFLAFYTLSAIGSSAISLLYRSLIAPSLTKDPMKKAAQGKAASVGASGAITSMTVLFACINPRATFNIFFFIPMPAWAAVIGFVGFDIYRSATNPSSRIDNAGHVGGALSGLAYYMYYLRPLIRRF